MSIARVFSLKLYITIFKEKMPLLKLVESILNNINCNAPIFNYTHVYLEKKNDGLIFLALNENQISDNS
jgi:hypothetical protein